MKITANIDRFEGDWAILLVDGVKIDWPCQLLPQGLKAGSWIDFTIKANPEKEKQVLENVQNLLDQLKQGKHLEE